MTEYDFSPAAYQKYLETQNRIARWVDKTRRYTPSNPFVPATPAVRPTSLDDAKADYRKDSTSSDRRHNYYSSKHKHRRNSSEPPPTAKPKRYSTSKSPQPPQMPPVRRSTAPIMPHPGVVILAPQHPVPSRPVRSRTTPVYSHPYPLERNSYSSYPNPVIPYVDGKPVRSSGHDRHVSKTIESLSA